MVRLRWHLSQLRQLGVLGGQRRLAVLAGFRRPRLGRALRRRLLVLLERLQPPRLSRCEGGSGA